jgi:hypothetical protein
VNPVPQLKNKHTEWCVYFLIVEVGRSRGTASFTV